MTIKAAELLTRRFLTRRAKLAMGSLGVQTSVPFEGIINLGSGTPSFQAPEHVVEAAKRALAEGYTKYTPWLGFLDLREAISDRLSRDTGVHFEPADEVMVTAGAQEALSVIFQTFCEQGDEVVLPDPYYNEYVRWASTSGATLVGVPTNEQAGFVVDPDHLARTITPRTKMIALTTPNNPTGTVLPRDVLEGIAKIAIERDLIVVSDELYRMYTYDGHQHVSISSFPGMKDRTIVVDGFSKTYSMTGFRIGYVAAPAPFVAAMLPIKHSFSICACAVSQRAALAALTGPTAWWESVIADCEARREQWAKALAALGVTYALPMGSYVFLVNVASLGVSGSQFSQILASQEKVRIGSGEPYGTRAKNHVRASLMVTETELEEGVIRIQRAAQRIRKGK